MDVRRLAIAEKNVLKIWFTLDIHCDSLVWLFLRLYYRCCHAHPFIRHLFCVSVSQALHLSTRDISEIKIKLSPHPRGERTLPWRRGTISRQERIDVKLASLVWRKMNQGKEGDRTADLTGVAWTALLRGR